MSRPTKVIDSFKGKEELLRLLCWLISATLLAYVINLFPIPFLPGLPLFAGSVVTLLASYYLGPWVGSCVALCASLPPGAQWGQDVPVSTVLLVLEAFYTGWMFRRVPRLRVVGTVLTYWLVVGCWLALLADHFLFHRPFTGSLLIQLHTLINPLLCALIAELIVFCGVPVLVRINGSKRGLSRLPLAELISLIFTIGISLPVLLHTVGDASHMRRVLLDRANGLDLARTKAVSDGIREILARPRTTLDGLAAALNPDQLPPTPVLEDWLRKTRERFPALAGICIMRPNGSLIASVPKLNTERLDWTLPADGSGPTSAPPTVFSEETLQHSDVHMAGGPSGTPVVPVVRRIAAQNGKPGALLVAWFQLSTFCDFVNRNYAEGTFVRLSIVDRHGTLVALSDAGERGKGRRHSYDRSADFQLASHSASGRQRLLDKDQLDADAALRSLVDLAAPFWLTWDTRPETEWRIYLKQSTGATVNALGALYTQAMLILLGCILAAYLVGRWMGSYLVKPLKVLEASAERLAHGELKHRPVLGSVYSCEIESLVASFKRMSENLDHSWTSQRALLQKISAREQEWQSTFHTISDAIFIFDSNGRVAKLNSAAVQLGSTQKMMRARPNCCQVIPQPQRGECLVHQAIRTGQRIQAELPDRTGRYPLLITVDPWRDSEGNTVGAICSLRDIRELRQTQEALRRQQNLLSRLMESAHDSILQLDLSGKILWGNNAASLALGLSPGEIIGKHFAEWIHDEQAETTAQYLKQTARGLPCVFETTIVRNDGVQRQFVMTCDPVSEGEEVMSTLIIARDASEQKEALQRASAAEKMRALGQLASGVAHDFNNNLAVILGRTQLLKLKTRDAELIRHLGVLEQAGQDAAAIVRRIQAFARQDHSQNFEHLDVNGLIQDAIELTRTRWFNEAQSKGINHQVRFLPGKEAWVMGNASELREVFVNLISNALDAMPTGGLLRIWTNGTPDGVETHFSDQGQGIPDNIKHRIFEPFFTTKGSAGTGLGLAVSYGIVLHHKGRIAVESAVGQGTTFTIHLPLAEASGPKLAVVQEQRSSSYEVLIVDDEANLREVLSEMLRMHGHKVTAASSAEEAVEDLELHSFDVVITDLTMPGIGGLALAEQIRRRWPATKILLASGYGRMQDINEDHAELADGVLSKPFDIRSLIEKLDEVVSSPNLNEQSA